MRLYSYTKGRIGKRDLGLPYHPLRLCTESYLYRRENGAFDKSKIDPDVCRQRAKTISQERGPVVLDIEAFNPFTERDKTEEAFRTAIGVYRDVNPHHRIGIYMYLPSRNYWTPVTYQERKLSVIMAGEMKEWQDHNNSWKTNRDDDGNWQGRVGIADLVDFVSPSLYFFYPNIKRNLIYLRHNLHQAARYDKPIIAWLWTQFHPTGTNPREYIGDELLKRTLWEIQKMADTERINLDGVVFFGGSDGHLPDSGVEIIREFFG